MTLEEIIQMALSRPSVERALRGKIIKEIIYVPNKLINIITE